MQSTRLIPALIALLLVSGCAATMETVGLIDPEAAFGSSVRSMIRNQTYDPAAAAVAPAPVALDGDKAALALKAYRSDKAGAATGRPISVSIGE